MSTRGDSPVTVIVSSTPAMTHLQGTLALCPTKPQGWTLAGETEISASGGRSRGQDGETMLAVRVGDGNVLPTGAGLGSRYGDPREDTPLVVRDRSRQRRGLRERQCRYRQDEDDAEKANETT
jgi:hypothetical protein